MVRVARTVTRIFFNMVRENTNHGDNEDNDHYDDSHLNKKGGHNVYCSKKWERFHSLLLV